MQQQTGKFYKYREHVYYVVFYPTSISVQELTGPYGEGLTTPVHIPKITAPMLLEMA